MNKLKSYNQVLRSIFANSKVWLLIVLISSAQLAFSSKIKEGVYRGVLYLNEIENIELPFNFEVKYNKKKPTIIIKNGDERIVVDEITTKKDSVNFKMPVFDTEFRCVLNKDNGLDGVWINHYRKDKNIIKFKAYFGESERFKFVPGKANPIFEGKWEVTFSPEIKDSTNAIGVFHHIEQTDYLTGTFLTESGDYRYLEGMKNQNEIYLSCFDGSHAFLFTGKLRNSQEVIDGKFYSGAHYSENWIGRRNPDFKLREAKSLTYPVVKGADIAFSFPDLNNKITTLNDDKFKNKPVIIQIMGSWCPNCMDESKYLSEVYKKYNEQGLEIIALSFEKTTDNEKARSQVSRMVTRLSIPYSVLITQLSGKDKASETFSFLNRIVAFPTTLFLNKQHQILRIHTGFSGPATGEEYEKFKKETEELLQYLIKE